MKHWKISQNEQCALLQELGICGGINCCLLNSIVLLVKLGGKGEGVSPTQSHSKFIYTAHIARAKKEGVSITLNHN